jgi:hypothetical protein
VTVADSVAHAPDISPEDNGELAMAAASMAQALSTLVQVVGPGRALRSMVLRLFVKAAGEQLTATEFEEIMQESEDYYEQADEVADPGPVPESGDGAG